MGRAENLLCGDSCVMYIKVDDKIISDARHTTNGCTITCVCADLLCEHIIGKPIDIEINLFELLGISIGINRRQCVITPQKALEQCLL